MGMADSRGGNSIDKTLYDREDDVRNLIDLLLEEGTEKHHPSVVLVPLVGDQGIGKTTLAQFIYEDRRVCEHFVRRGWVSFSKVSDPTMLVRQTLESITLSSWSWVEPITLQRCLEDELKNKRFLIVFDDFCAESSKYLEIVRESLSLGLPGSKILPIMRESSIINAFPTTQSHRLERLSDESCWQLFRKYAFPSHDHGIDRNLTSPGRKISEKCNGMLLPIEILGSFLCNESDRFVWETICESDKWDSGVSQNLVFPALKICYDSLPPELKSCLSCCSLFPKSHLFDKDQLIRLWAAQGYINPAKGKELERIGCEYFDQSLRNWFFRCSSHDYNKQGFALQHQVFDMLNISFVRGKDRRRLSYVTEKDESAAQLKCLHTFLVITKSESSSFRRLCCDVDLIDFSFSTDFFYKMRSLRALDLSYTCIEELPDSIGALINLRFLGANCTKIKTLPRSICNLHNLQTLELNDCSYLVSLPVEISSLSNLRHLLISKAYSFARLPRGIGKLTSLVTLSTFYVGSDSSSYVITELKNLVNLRGELRISGLSNIISADDALEANMKNKEFVDKLILEWNSNDFRSKSYMSKYVPNDRVCEDEHLLEKEEKTISQNEEVETDIRDEDWISKIDVSCDQVSKTSEERFLNRRRIFLLREGVLESLQPHANIKELVLENYQGRKLSSWMSDSSLTKLVSISLSNCSECEVLPPLGQLPSLKHLLLHRFNKLKHLRAEFYGRGSSDAKPFSSLEKLELDEMYALEEWGGVDGAFPLLLELRLNYCQKLKTMPRVFSSLKNLKLSYCEQLTRLPNAPLMSSLDLVHCNKNIVSVLPKQITELGSIKIYWDKFVDFTYVKVSL